MHGGRGDSCSLRSHHQESAQGNNKESAKGKNQESAQRNNQESAAWYSITATYNLNSFHSVAITCMAASVENALHQTHWHRKRLRRVPKQRSPPKAGFSASRNNVLKAIPYRLCMVYVCSTIYKKMSDPKSKEAAKKYFNVDCASLTMLGDCTLPFHSF